MLAVDASIEKSLRKAIQYGGAVSVDRLGIDDSSSILIVDLI
jgi:hypothetical protein